jgi:hypothetical protein
MKNFFVAEFGAKPAVIAENNTHFINDAEMHAKWANLMQWLETNVDKNERQWTKINGYLLCGLGRWMVGVSSGAALKDTVPSGEGFDYASIGQVRTDKQEFTVFSLVKDNKLPVAAKEGCVFVGWTAGGKAYDAITAAELSGKTLTPVFVDTTNTNVFDIKWASARQAAKGEGALSVTNATYVNGAIWPSAVFRDKILLKYTEDGKLEVVAFGLNGVRLSKNSSDSYYVEGQSNLDFDLVIIGYSAEADTVIKGLNLEAGDIIEIAALNSVYDVLDGADPDNWTPDHEVNVKAYITYAN